MNCIPKLKVEAEGAEVDAGATSDLVAKAELDKAPTAGVDDLDGGLEPPVPFRRIGEDVGVVLGATPKEKVADAAEGAVADVDATDAEVDAAPAEARGATTTAVEAAAVEEVTAKVETASTAVMDPLIVDGAPNEADLVSVG